jgi:trehalose 6-phosphate phosphatase
MSVKNRLDSPPRPDGCQSDDVLLFVAAYDGVLAEYQDDPAVARVPPARLARLRRLQRLPRVALAVISGRPLDDLRSRSSLAEGAYYIGLHGLEIAGPQVTWTCGEEIRRYCDCMSNVAMQLQDLVREVPGVRVECKGPIVALHTREAAPEHVVWSRFQFLSAASDLVNTESVRPLRGHDVLELVPNVGCSRAEALSAVRRCVEARYQRSAFTIYIGEDIPDDGAATAIGALGVAAVVGRRTQAAHHLDSSEDLDAVLDELIANRLPGVLESGG